MTADSGDKYSAARSSGSIVADNPIRWSFRPLSFSSLAMESIRCAPRFVSIIACSSSRITALTVLSISCTPFDVSIR